MGTTKALLTFEEFERLPDQPGKRELVKGELIELPPAKKRHNKAGERIFLRLLSAIQDAKARGEAQQLGEACIEMGYLLSADSWLQPDVSVSHPRQKGDEYLEGAPAIAIEIVSPRNTADEIATKTRLYFEHGPCEVWRVYLKARYAELHVPGSSRVVLPDQSITTPLLPGFGMRVSEVLGE